MMDDDRLRLRSPFIPLLLLTVALLSWATFQTVQLARDRRDLRAAYTNQEQPMQQAAKMRAQLDGIARSTAELASKGNANAGTIVQELAKRGITINLNAPPAVSAPK